MSTIHRPKQCLICSGNYKVLISPELTLPECQTLTASEVLQTLHFPAISDVINGCQTLCLICVAKIQSCYQLIVKCSRINKSLRVTPKRNYCKRFMANNKSILENMNNKIEENNLETMASDTGTRNHSVFQPKVDIDHGNSRGKNVKIRQMKKSAKRLRSSSHLLSPASNSDLSSMESSLVKKPKRKPYESKQSPENDGINNELYTALELMKTEISELKNRVQLLENENEIMKLDIARLDGKISNGKKELTKTNNSEEDRNFNDIFIVNSDNEEVCVLDANCTITGQIPNCSRHLQAQNLEDDVVQTKTSKPRHVRNRYEKITTIDRGTGKKIDMIYIGEDVNLKAETWESIKNQKGDSKFVKNLAQALWTRYELVNRCLSGAGTARLPNRSPRKILTPKKRRLVEDLFKDRLKQQNAGMSEKVLEKNVKVSGRYLTELINDLIKREKRNIK